MRANGSTAVFTVDAVQRVVKSAFPTSDVYGNVKYPGLRLITCGGPFDTATGSIWTTSWSTRTCPGPPADLFVNAVAWYVAQRG
jgi:hypothetical protein